ncbi:unnamed protein product [Mytilus coruscus]|uniref:Amine oxidase domain-containing protein n=1 Tax=Mytilus coruscus TaxID=42192 RepID=A0A6J8APX4_MYTCO|nr:unnamed protein product [Mytilus coruscus]
MLRAEKMTSKKRVLIVGAGAAGTAAAYSLSKHPEKFQVEVWEKLSVPGGVACSSDIKGDAFVNYGVQGGTPSYRNTLIMMNEFGFKTSPVHMMISFGKGKTHWTNYAKSPLTEKLKNEIKRFEDVLKKINRFEFFYIFVPMYKVLKWNGFSDDFANEMVFPLTALFFGTGNRTPYVSAAIMARVFLDEDLRLFDYDSELLLSQSPEMFAFPKLEQMYETILRKSGVKICLNRPITSVKRYGTHVTVIDQDGKTATFDEILFACDAETVLKLLENPTFLERKALGNVKYYNDLILTHEDDNYMNKHYEVNKDKDQYFVRTDPTDPAKIEMSFNLSNYQPQLKNSKRNIYQTIYLDDNLREKYWTVNEVKKDKVLLETWWRQFSHSWTHFAFTVPLMRYLQGKKHTWFCGAYTLINTHEIAMISGLAAAHRLGAPYPFHHDALAAKQFDQYLLTIHGKPRNFGCNKMTLMSCVLAPLMALFALFSLLLRFCCNRKSS